MGTFLSNLFAPEQKRRANYVEQDAPDIFSPAAPAPNQYDTQAQQIGGQLDTALQAKPPGRGAQLIDALLGPDIGPVISGTGGRKAAMDNLVSRYKLADEQSKRQHQQQTDTLNQNKYNLDVRQTNEDIRHNQAMEKEKNNPTDVYIESEWDDNNVEHAKFRSTNGNVYLKPIIIPEGTHFSPKKPATATGGLEAQGYADALKRDPSMTIEKYHKIYDAAGRAPTGGAGSRADDPKALLSPAEAAALGVPYGSKRSDAFGKAPVNPKRAEAETRVSSLESDLDRMAEAANALKTHPGLAASVGLKGPTNYLSGTDSAGFKTNLETLRSQISFGTLQKMREMSKTGGALGQVSDKEGKLLQDNIAGLDTAQKETEFRAALDKVVKFANDSKARLRKSLDSDSGDSATTFIDGGKTYNIPAGMEQEFLKDHPNAKR